MDKMWLLLKAEIYNTFSINELITKGSKNKRNVALMGIGGLMIIAYGVAYTVMIALNLVDVGSAEIIPTYMVSIASFITLALSFLCSNGILFAIKDYEMLLALPVSSTEVILSKFAFMYLINLVLCIILMIPAGIVWVTNTQDNILFFVMYVIGTFFVPLIPMCISILAGIIITVLSSKFKNRNIFSLIFSLICIGCIMGISMYSSKSGNTGELGVTVISQVSNVYPPSRLFMYDSQHGCLKNTLFLIISALVFLVCIEIASSKYTYISMLMRPNNDTGSAKIQQKKHSKLRAMYTKEIARFFNSYLYMLNSGLGVFALFAVSIVIAITSPYTLGKLIGIENITPLVGEFAPLAIAAMLAISCTTSASISLEGNNIWILQSIPMSNEVFFKAKILLNMSFHAVGYIFAFIVIVLKFDLTFTQIVTLIVVPVGYSIFISVQGIYFNSKFPKFDWDNETMVIKQSVSVAVSTLIGLLSVIIPAALWFALGISLQTILWVMTGVLLVVSIVLYKKACRIKIV